MRRVSQNTYTRSFTAIKHPATALSSLRHRASNVNGIKNVEAQTLNVSVQKIYFQPDVNLDLAIAQIVSATNSIRALMPPASNALNALRAAAPAGMRISELFDQSVFVRDAVLGVVREDAIAAGLAALMALDPRSPATLRPARRIVLGCRDRSA
jgi:multidrug efflux pump subunit AcrB